MKYGFVNVASVIPEVKVGDVNFNISKIEEGLEILFEKNVDIAVFPELCVTGYSCQDLFFSQNLLSAAENGIINLIEKSLHKPMIFVVGVPVYYNGGIYNCAVVIQNGNICGIIPKTYLPNYKEFYESRWFTSGDVLKDKIINLHFAGQNVELTGNPKVFSCEDGYKFGVEICEDVWTPIPPSSYLALAGADIILNLSASDELTAKNAYLRSLLSQQSARTMSGYVYSSCGYGESTQDVVYCGNGLIYENGSLVNANKRFEIKSQIVYGQIDIEKLRAERMNNTSFHHSQKNNLGNFDEISLVSSQNNNDDFEITRTYSKTPFLGSDLEEVFSIQTLGLMKRLSHVGTKKVVIGVSGGSDSTLALLVCVKAFDRLGWDRKGIIGVTMPCFGTTSRTKDNSIDLMEKLGITSMTVNIKDAVNQHFIDINLDPNDRSVTYENCQARERTQVLMDIANKENGLVIGTGDLSELALGWCTYNADHMSMYNVNVSIPKTLVKELIRYYSSNTNNLNLRSCLEDILDTPVSPELLPPNEDGTIQQVTEDNIGPYILHDFFLYHFIRFGYSPKKLFAITKHTFKEDFTDEIIKKWLKVFFRRFFTQQFKRSCLPDGPKVGSVSLSPRGDWRMPSDASFNLWITEIDSIVCEE